MNIFLRELKANLKSLLIWVMMIGLLTLSAVTEFSAYYGDPEILKILDTMPPFVMEMMNMNAFNLTTLSGFYGVMFLYLSLMGAIAATMWGSDIISKEERDKTVEFSLVLPLSRNQMVTAKALAALVNCILLVLITWGISIVAVQSYNPDLAFYDFLALEMQAMFMIELIFLAVGILLGCAFKRYKRAGSTAVGIILSTYFISIIAGMNENFEFLKHFTPFHYYNAADLFRSGELNTTYVGVSVAIILVCMIAAYWTYNKRDLYI